MRSKNTKKVCSFDFETTGLRPYHGDRAFAFCIGHENGDVEVWRFDEGKRQALNRLKSFLADETIVKVAHNLKYDYTFCKVHKIKMHPLTEWHDTMIMMQMLRNNEVSYALDYLTWKYARWKVEEDKEVEKQAKRRGGYHKVDKELMFEYQVADGQRTMMLYQSMIDDLKNDPKLYECYRNEIDLIFTTQRIEQNGLLLDKRNLNKLQKWLRIELDKVNNDLQKYISSRGQKSLLSESKTSINLNSTKQVQSLLFGSQKNGGLNLKPISLTNTGQPSVDKNTIFTLREQTKHPIFDLILKSRSYTNGLGTIHGYIRNAEKGQRLHPEIKTNHASTGRESCSNPNLQNVQKEGNDRNPFPVPLRSVLRTDPHHDLYLIDYSGIEMRLIIDATQEPEMIDILAKDGDVHHPVVQCFLGVKEADNLRDGKPDEYEVIRRMYKNVHFGIAYGAGTTKVAQTLEKSVTEIQAGDFTYRKRFPKIAKFSSAMIRQVKHHGFVETAHGRKLYISEEKAHAGSNAVIQGTAAEILKHAQVNVDKWILKNRLQKYIKIVLPIHDEIVFDFDRGIDKNETMDMLKNICRIMIDMPKIRVKLDVDVKKTRSTWDKAKKIKVRY